MTTAPSCVGTISRGSSGWGKVSLRTRLPRNADLLSEAVCPSCSARQMLQAERPPSRARIPRFLQALEHSESPLVDVRVRGPDIEQQLVLARHQAWARIALETKSLSSCRGTSTTRGENRKTDSGPTHMRRA